MKKISTLVFGTLFTISLFNASDARAQFSSLSITDDVSKGGRLFSFTFNGAEVPETPFYPTLYIEKDGVLLQLSEWEEAAFLTCRKSSIPACSYLLAGDADPGHFNVFLSYDFWPAPEYYEDSFSVDITTAIPSWWTEVTTHSDTDIFNGDTDVSIRFNNVPAGVTNFLLEAMYDSDFNGESDTVLQSLNCSEDNPSANPRVVNCIGNVGPLCTENNENTCNGEFIDFRLNGSLYIPFSVDGVHYQLTAWEEGSFFGRQNFDQGGRLESRLDMHTYLRIDPGFDECFYGAGSFLDCFDVGYYDAWIGSYSGAIQSLMTSEGRFDVDLDPTLGAGVARVNVNVPMLPIGAHGFRVDLLYQKVGDGSSLQTKTLTCTAAGCSEETITGLEDGEYLFSINVINNHPKITLYDEGYEPYEFGQFLFKTFTHAPVVIETSSIEICHKGKKTKRVAASEVNDHLNHGDQIGKCVRGS